MEKMPKIPENFNLFLSTNWLTVNKNESTLDCGNTTSNKFEPVKLLCAVNKKTTEKCQKVIEKKI